MTYTDYEDFKTKFTEEANKLYNDALVGTDGRQAV